MTLHVATNNGNTIHISAGWWCSLHNPHMMILEESGQATFAGNIRKHSCSRTLNWGSDLRTLKAWFTSIFKDQNVLALYAFFTSRYLINFCRHIFKTFIADRSAPYDLCCSGAIRNLFNQQPLNSTGNANYFPVNLFPDIDQET